MSSSRSIAAARNRRAGEGVPNPKVSNVRPMTSISAQPAFTNPGSQKTPQQASFNNAGSQKNTQHPAQKSNGLPFTKLSISDAIGLITLRLGKVEQFLIDQENNPPSDNNIMSYNIDNTLISTFSNRLDELETNNSSSQTANTILSNEISALRASFANMQQDIVSFKTEMNIKFDDYETAIADLETKILPSSENASLLADEISIFKSLDKNLDKPLDNNILDTVSETDENEEDSNDIVDNSLDDSKHPKKGKGKRKKINL
jgi:hypothetical protein